MHHRLVTGLAVALLAGCNSGGSSSDTTTPTTPTTPVAPAMALLAGNVGGAGDLDGAVANARFVYPERVAIDAAGNLYVADRAAAGTVVRKITAAGTVSRITWNAGGAAGAQALAVDSAGNLFQVRNNVLYKKAVDGTETALAGFKAGHADGAGAAAGFDTIRDAAVDGSGNIYLAEEVKAADRTDGGYYCYVRKVTPAGVASTLPYRSQSLPSRPAQPCRAAVATDSTGTVYTLDNEALMKITPAGAVSLLAGNNGGVGSLDGTGVQAGFIEPQRLAAGADGSVYVSDGTATIRKVTSGGVVTTLAGKANTTIVLTGGAIELGTLDGTGTVARFGNAAGLAVDAAGNVYVADATAANIRKITAAGVVTTVTGPAGAASIVTAVAGQLGANPWAGRTDATGVAASFSNPSGMVVDTTGNIIISDAGSGYVRTMSVAGVVTSRAFVAAAPPASRIGNATGVGYDATGNVYVADAVNQVIRKVTATGLNTIFAGLAGVAGKTNGPANVATFTLPSMLTADKDGNVYVVDDAQHIIRKVTAAGVASDFVGAPGQTGVADGTGTAARLTLSANAGIATDSTGNVYFSDYRTIRKVTPAGVVSTVAGSIANGAAVDGKGAAAGIANPTALTVDSAGVVYFVDGPTVRKIATDGTVTTVVGTQGANYLTPGALPGTILTPGGLARSGTSLFLSMYNGIVEVKSVP